MFRSRISIGKLASVLAGAMMISLVFAQAGVDVAEHDEHGSHLVDGEGLSLYAYLPDAEAEGSTCEGTCAQAWPPLTTEGDPEPSDAVDEELLDTVERTGGAEQVTYDGWPLYSYIQDRETGSAAGQGMGDDWYLIAPDGTLIGANVEPEGSEQGEAGSEAPAAAEDVDVEALMAEGEAVYGTACASCHGADGDATNGAHVRRITEADSTVADGPRLIRQIMYGGSYMPGFGDQLSNDEIMAVATYVRNSFGHDLGPVTREEVIGERERFN